MIRLMIADDHALMRESLKKLFTSTDDLDVVAEAPNGDVVIELLNQVNIDLIVMDVSMPGISGADLISKIKATHPLLPILVLTMHNEPQIAHDILSAGALGYVTKDSDPDVLLSTVRKIANGGRFISYELAEQLAFDSFNCNELNTVLPHKVLTHRRLSKRELQIFCKLVNGLTINTIATELGISSKTVSAHKSRLMEKMDIDNYAKLVQYAINHGFVK